MLTGESGLESQVERELRPNDFQVAPSIYVDLTTSTHSASSQSSPIRSIDLRTRSLLLTHTFSHASRPLPMMHVRAEVN